MGNFNEGQQEWARKFLAILGKSGATSPATPSPGASVFGATDRASADTLQGAVIGGVLRQQSSSRNGGTKGDSTPSKGTAPAGSSPPAGHEGLPKKAKVTMRRIGQQEYDFGRPITMEQAAQVIFRDGKVPREAQLRQGPGENNWTLLTNGQDDLQVVVGKMRSHRETFTKGKANTSGGTVQPPDPDVVDMEWTDSPSKTRTGPERRDQNNNLGFKITKRYPLDEGKAPTKQVQSLGDGGQGYELVFKQPLTEDQVVDALLINGKPSDDTVQLKAVPHEPSNTWDVRMIGDGAPRSLKPSVLDAISDATVYVSESLPPRIPPGIVKYLESKTLPKDVRTHPHNVYTWEQDGYIIRVQTDGKGKDGYYDYETTELVPDDEASNLTMRYFILVFGMESRQAWREYIKHWDEIDREIMGAFALALASGRSPSEEPETVFMNKMREPNVEEEPEVLPTDVAPDPEPALAGRSGEPAENESNIGMADTDPVPATPKQPALPPEQPAGGKGTVADSQAPVQPRDRGPSDSEIAAENERVKGFKSPRIPSSPGDGEPVPIETAFEQLGKKDGTVIESSSHKFHKEIWQNYLKQPGDPPLAFKFSNRTRVDIEKLPPDQFKQFVEMEKAQADALRR